MKKKVLFIITKATWGGAQRYVYDIATNLPKNEFEPTVAFGMKGKLTEDLAATGIPTRQLPSLSRDVSFISDIKSFFEILSTIKELRPDVIHLNSSKASALGALAARMLGVKNIIFTVHGWPFREARNPFVKLLIWKISWLSALLSHRVICVSDHDLKEARRMPLIRKKAIRIYNGLSPMTFGSGERIRNAFPRGVRITGTIGELTKNKNQIELIERAKRDPTMYVAIVGEGEERGLLERKIQEYDLGGRVKLFGFMHPEEALRGFDRFALPSIKEGLPYVLLEARAAGVPIEANRVGGVSEILEKKDIGEFSLPHMLERTLALYRER